MKAIKIQKMVEQKICEHVNSKIKNNPKENSLVQ